MPKILSDSHRVILACAAARDSLRALPMPSTIRKTPEAIAMLAAELIEQGLLARAVAEGDDPIWHQAEDGTNTTLIITDLGMLAIGIRPQNDDAIAVRPALISGQIQPETSKLHAIVALLQRPEGAVMDELVLNTAWQKHSIRGAISGVLRGKHSLHVSSRFAEGRGRVYRIETPQAPLGTEPTMTPALSEHLGGQS